MHQASVVNMTTLFKNEYIIREAKGGHVPPVPTPPPPGDQPLNLNRPTSSRLRPKPKVDTNLTKTIPLRLTLGQWPIDA